MATTHTGPMVRMKGRMVSLAECELRSKARKTRTVPYTRKTNATPMPVTTFQLTSDGMVEEGGEFK